MIMKRELKIGNAMAAAVLSGLFFAISPMVTAEEMSNAEKIEFIDKIIETKIKEAGGGDVRWEVLAAVAKKIPLDSGETPESTAIINKIKQKVRQEYPLSDQELTEKYMTKAESLYPFYKQGDNANITFLLHGKKFYVSGPYYRSDLKYVWVGSKKILKSTIPPEQICRFDAKATQLKRSEYIKAQIDAYHRKANIYEEGLLGNQYDNLEASRNKIKINGKWQTARVVTLEKYAEADEQIANIILAIQRKLTKKFDIQNNEKCCQQLESFIRNYPNHKYAENAKELLEHFHDQKIVAVLQAVQLTLEQKYNFQNNKDCCQLLETFLRNYPDHKYAENAKELLEKLHDQKIVAVLQAVQESPDIESYEKCCQLLESIIREFPDHEHMEKAKELLTKIKREYPIKLASREAVRQIVVDDSNQAAQITIRKLINPGNQWMILVFPIDLKSKAVSMNQDALNTGKCYQLYKQKRKEADRLTYLIENAKADPDPDYLRISKLSSEKARVLFSAKDDLRQGLISLAKLSEELIPHIGGNSNVRYVEFQDKDSCILCNIKEPIILFAYEKIHISDELEIFQSWYLEYTPEQTIEWKLE